METVGKPSEKIVSLHIPPRLLEQLDALVEKGLFKNRSEAVRYAILLLLRECAWLAARENLMMVPLR